MSSPLIAVVDDELPVRTALGHLLLAAGFRVLTYATGGEFLQVLRENTPDCAVLDLHMPGLTGFDVLRCLSAMKSVMPVVIITGHDQPNTRERVLLAGAHAYLTKPVLGVILLDAVNNAMQQAGSDRVRRSGIKRTAE